MTYSTLFWRKNNKKYTFKIDVRKTEKPDFVFHNEYYRHAMRSQLLRWIHLPTKETFATICIQLCNKIATNDLRPTSTGCFGLFSKDAEFSWLVWDASHSKLRVCHKLNSFAFEKDSAIALSMPLKMPVNKSVQAGPAQANETTI